MRQDGARKLGLRDFGTTGQLWFGTELWFESTERGTSVALKKDLATRSRHPSAGHYLCRGS